MPQIVSNSAVVHDSGTKLDTLSPALPDLLQSFRIINVKILR